MSLVSRLVSSGVRAVMCQAPQNGGLLVHFIFLDSPCVLDGAAALAWMRETSARLFADFGVKSTHVMSFDGRFVLQVYANDDDQAWWCERRRAWFSASDFHALPDAIC